MRSYDILDCKRHGIEHTREQLQFLINGYVSGEIPDYQMSAWLMAVCCNGMTERETAYLTEIMAESGDTVDLSRFGDTTVDKHSTGGVGDKTSLVIAPIAASLGCRVAKMSGRGLGHTGGTIDKLESIPGYKTVLTPQEFFGVVERTGMAMIGQSGDIAPADKKLYALRDVTATVESIPLITSSIMSKKLAAGARSIVLDVKVGSGAFMKTLEDAKTLAGSMVDIGRRLGRRMTAVLSSMDVPLGYAIGNSLEVVEAVSVLKGESKGDLYEVCVALATEMVSLSLKMDTEDARKRVIDAIESGKAFEKLLEWVSAQGGDQCVLEDTSLFKQAEYSLEVKAHDSGFITAMDAASIGSAGVILGAGRLKKEDAIDPAAGIILRAKTGDRVTRGDLLCTLYSGDRSRLEEAHERFLDSVKIGDVAPEKQPLIYEIMR